MLKKIKKINSIVLCVSLLIVGLLSGCSKNVEPDTVTYKEITPEPGRLPEPELPEYDFPELYQEERDSVTFETAIIINNREDMGSFVKTTAELQAVDKDKLFEEFFSDIPSYDEYEHESKNEKGEKVTTITYVASGETHLSIGPYSSMFNYSSPELSPYVNRAFRLDEKYDDYNADKYSLEHEFSFASKKESFTDIKDCLQEAGIQIGDSYKAYALDHATMQQEEYCMGMNGQEDKSGYKQSWTKEDDCYYFIMRQDFHGLPVYHVFSEVFKDAADINAPVQVQYSAKGIESIYVEKVFAFKQDGQEVILVDFADIAETVFNKYGMILGSSSYKVTEARLHYMVDVMSGKGVYEVFPVWILSIEESTPDEGVTGTLQMIINAATTEEVP